MSDAIVAWIRTVVPAITGFALAELLKFGIEIDGAALNLVLSGFLVGVWYAVASWLQRQFPAFGWLLGYPKAPTYDA